MIMVEPTTPCPRPPRARRAVARQFAFFGRLFAFVIGGLSGWRATGWQETRAQIARLSWVQHSEGCCWRLSWSTTCCAPALACLYPPPGVYPPERCKNIRHFLGGSPCPSPPAGVGELIRIALAETRNRLAVERTARWPCRPARGPGRHGRGSGACRWRCPWPGIAFALPVAILALAAAYVADTAAAAGRSTTLFYRATGWLPRLMGPHSAGPPVAGDLFPRATVIAGLCPGPAWAGSPRAMPCTCCWLDGRDIGLLGPRGAVFTLLGPGRRV